MQNWSNPLETRLKDKNKGENLSRDIKEHPPHKGNYVSSDKNRIIAYIFSFLLLTGLKQLHKTIYNMYCWSHNIMIIKAQRRRVGLSCIQVRK